MNKRVKVGIIGLGDHCSQSHIKHLITMTDICQIVAVCDLDVEKAKKVCNELNVPDSNDLYYHGAFEDLIRNDKVEAVFIMTPDRFHLDQLIACTKAKKHVFCEKPLASTQDEYERLEHAFSFAAEHNLVITTCHPRRFDTPFETIRAFIVNGATHCGISFGQVLNFEFYFQYHQPSKKGLHTSLMFDHLNHEVDAMHFLFGQNMIKNAIKHNDAETGFHVSGSRLDGISFSFIGQRKLNESIYPEYMKINFEHGFVHVDLHMGEARYIAEGSHITELIPKKYKTDYMKRFEAINRNFLESILGISENYLTAKEMLMNTKLAIDLHEQTFVQY